MIVIGLTGSVGMGKTTAANMLREMGFPVHDADAAVHGLMGSQGRAVPIVGKIFPEAVKQDSQGHDYIDRQILGRIVFADRARKRELENILHPMVREESDAFVSQHRQKAARAVVLDIPLLFETGGEKRVDVTVCVSAPATVQKERVLARPGMTAEKFDMIVAGQMPDGEKRKRADYVVETGTGIEDTKAQLRKVIEHILTHKAKRNPTRINGLNALWGIGLPALLYTVAVIC